MNIQEIEIDKIKPYAKNAKKHDKIQIDNVAESIKQFGFVQPLVLTDDNTIVIGHCRHLAAKKLKMKTVPCVYVSDLTDEQIKKLRNLDNKLNESEWDFDLLKGDIFGLDFKGFEIDWGFDLTETIEPTDIIEDEAPEVDEKSEPVCKLGDIWQLGEHRLICGDSTNKATIERLMNGEKADMVFTDPPYNVAIGSKNAALNSVQKAGHCTEDLIGDKGMTDEEVGEKLWKPAFLNLLNSAKDDCSIYCTMPQGGTHMMMMMMMSEAGWQVKHELMWLKNSPTFSMGRLDYDYKHEPILYGWAKSHNYYGKGKYKNSVWEIAKPRKCDLHPTMKPIELIANALQNSSKENDLIIDFFGGSGSTLIACEQLNRKCYMSELSPKYCDVIIKRWENYTGKQAVKIS
jgi:site-specific DNA-methyltransferase (adenine-specific)